MFSHLLLSFFSSKLTAKDTAAQTYRPILLGINVIYLLLVFGLKKGDNGASTSMLPYGVWGCLGMLSAWGVQIYAYMGILEQSQNAKQKKGEIAGGVYLDYLGLSVAVQFLSVLHTTKWFWILVTIPAYALYSLYTTLYGGGGKGGAAAPQPQEQDDPDAAAKEERRQKRAEKRKQKRG